MEAPKPGSLNRQQKDLVDWFFIRLMNIYGNRFRTQFASSEQIVAAKVEWGDMICGSTREQLHAKLEVVKREGNNPDLKWPNIAYILALSSGASPTGVNEPAYRPPQTSLPSPGALAQARPSGEEALANMRESLLDSTTECRKSDRRSNKRGRRSSDHTPAASCPGKAHDPSQMDCGGFW
ncbi:hypothetical protein DRQ53_08035 [bacterium]|nr:MAG: hypothetical protein DRQ53_08035 [bacterium]